MERIQHNPQPSSVSRHNSLDSVKYKNVNNSVPQIFSSFVGPIPIMVLISIPGAILLAYTIYCIIRHQEPYYIRPFTVYSFFVSVCALTFVCSVLINFVELIQILTGANSVFLGLTVFSWANSIGGKFAAI